MRVPAEWEPQSAIWIAWPHNTETWPGHFDKIPNRFREIISVIAQTLPVHVIGHSQWKAQARVDQIDNATWHEIETNDCWIRDFGPTYVLDEHGKRTAVDWRYNSWGGKYPPWDSDDAAAPLIAKLGGWNCVRSELCVEGGALEWDGGGRLMTTSSCLVTDTRNPGWTRREIGAHLQKMAGLREIILVDGGGLVGDDTDGHIDQLARFIDRQTVVVATCDDPHDENHAGLEKNWEILSQWASTTSPRVNVVRLPIPPARFVEGQRVPESYCNFLRLGPERTLVPQFGNATTDTDALELLATLTRRKNSHADVVGIDCRDLVWGLGALHCASLNEPKG